MQGVEEGGKGVIPYQFKSIYLFRWETATWIQIALLQNVPVPPYDEDFFEKIPPLSFSGIRHDQVSLIPATSFKYLSPATVSLPSLL